MRVKQIEVAAEAMGQAGRGPRGRATASWKQKGWEASCFYSHAEYADYVGSGPRWEVG